MKSEKSITVSGVLLIIFRIAFTFFALYSVWFIFSNSLEAGAASSLRSAEVTKKINAVITAMGMSPLSNHTVRKLAHYGEYLGLGFWFMLCLRVYTRKYIRHISWPLLLGLLVACGDETIQLYVSGRSSSLKDVWIDFGGVCSGVGAALLILLLVGGILYLMGFGRHRNP